MKLTNDNGDDIGFRPSSPTSNDQGENTNENDNDWIDELNDDDDSAGEDSDDEGLNSKLCTFTQTQKEFMNQHWYHCHTCKMVDGVGVCTVCAKVCHSNCDVTYSKHGSFFCDCGAKEDGSCLGKCFQIVQNQPNIIKIDRNWNLQKLTKFLEWAKLIKMDQSWPK